MSDNARLAYCLDRQKLLLKIEKSLVEGINKIEWKLKEYPHRKERIKELEDGLNIFKERLIETRKVIQDSEVLDQDPAVEEINYFFNLFHRNPHLFVSVPKRWI